MKRSVEAVFDECERHTLRYDRITIAQNTVIYGTWPVVYAGRDNRPVKCWSAVRTQFSIDSYFNGRHLVKASPQDLAVSVNSSHRSVSFMFVMLQRTRLLLALASIAILVQNDFRSNIRRVITFEPCSNAPWYQQRIILRNSSPCANSIQIHPHSMGSYCRWGHFFLDRHGLTEVWVWAILPKCFCCYVRWGFLLKILKHFE